MKSTYVQDNCSSTSTWMGMIINTAGYETVTQAEEICIEKISIIYVLLKPDPLNIWQHKKQDLFISVLFENY